MASTQQAPQVCRGFVKQVLSGDSIVIRGQPKGGPPPERTIALSNITAPRLARRPNPNVENQLDAKDEPFAWEAREFLRKRLVGKEVFVTIEYKVPASGREYGTVHVGKDSSGENISESLVAEGLAEVRRTGGNLVNEAVQQLITIEDTAKAGGKGKWAAEGLQDHVRDVKWTLENPRHFVDSLHGQPVSAVIEHVRDGCTVRAFVLPSFHYITLMISGIKCPMFKLEGDKQVVEQYAEEAKFCTESRLLQRDVELVLESVSNQNVIGSIIHPNGNIAELLLREGFARCVDWSMASVTQGPEKLRAAEKSAKEKKMRLWKDYKAPTQQLSLKDFSGKVVEVVNGDSMMVKCADGSVKKIFLASIRPPRPLTDSNAEGAKPDPKSRPRPLYDIPYMFEAREFLRKKLIGNKVNVSVDYIQPASEAFPEKTCCTVTISGINVAEALVSKGLATVVRYRQDNDQRSAHYDALLAAEDRAKKKGAGVHSKKEVPAHRVADVSGDLTKAKQFLPFLQRAGRVEAVVEFVASGSRLRVFIPRETCLITFLLSGIDCPRGSRPGPDGSSIPGDPCGHEAMLFTKERVLQREVEVEVEAMDKGGNFIGWLQLDGTNLSVSLVEQGLAKVHSTAERSNYYKALCAAEERAKAEKLGIWAHFVEEPTPEVVEKEEPKERRVDYRKVVITEVSDKDLHIFTQSVDNGPQLEKMMEQLRLEMSSNPPLPGAYIPKKGDLCAAKFSTDNEWYRARVQKVEGNNAVHVYYIDYGNREVTSSQQLATLPSAYHMLPAQCTEYALACVQLPTDEDDVQNLMDNFYNDVMNRELLLNVEYRGSAGCDCVSLQYPDTKQDVVQSLVVEGLVLVEKRRERFLHSLISTYLKAQDEAKNKRVNLWQYGDFREDDAKEFGYQR